MLAQESKRAGAAFNQSWMPATSTSVPSPGLGAQRLLQLLRHLAFFASGPGFTKVAQL
jgi:hypothetical protein